MALALLPPSVSVSHVSDGIVLSSPAPLPPPAPNVLAWLDRWEAEAPERPFLAERDAGGAWARVTYGEVARAVPRVAAALAERGVGPGGPLLVLSDNSVAQAMVTLAAYHLGAPVVPASPAYSLVSQTFRRLHHVAALVEPAAIFAEERAPFEKALAGLASSAPVLTATGVRSASDRGGGTPERAAIGPSTVAKVLFTSGSTGEPKGVVNTHGMLTANQESLLACWPFLHELPPVVVDWLPWSHTFGGNHNFNLILRNGGTLYIDRGRPAPGLLMTTLENLADVGPTIWFNVPRGFDQAVGELERDPAIARAALRNLRVLFYAAAALGTTTRVRLEAVARDAGNPEIFFTSAWGSTETSPLATSAHFATRTTGNLGLPVPGVEIKLARADDRFELRVKGPNVTPGTWRRGGAIAPATLDADGFLPTGDAGKLVDDAHPEAGITFVGRLSENFKLSSGTWVNVATVRLGLVEACAPLLLDAVVCGQDRDALGALLLVSPLAAKGIAEDELRLRLHRGIERYNQTHGSSSEHIARALVLGRPLSLDDGETTDKGYTNQRRVREHRAAEVELLFASPPALEVFVL